MSRAARGAQVSACLVARGNEYQQGSLMEHRVQLLDESYTNDTMQSLERVYQNEQYLVKKLIL